MHPKLTKFALFSIFCFSILICVSPAMAVVENEAELLTALEETVDPIEISGDIILTAPLSIDHSVTIAASGDASLLVSSQDIDGEYYSQNMIYVTGEDTTVSFNGITFGFQETDADEDVYFWSLINVSDGASLTVADSEFEGYDESGYRSSLNAISVSDSTLRVEESDFAEFDLSGILLGSGAQGVEIASSDFTSSPVGVLTAHDTLEAYGSEDDAITNLDIHGNSFINIPFGIVVLPNVESADITRNAFYPCDTDEDGDDDGSVYSGLTVLPVGVARIPELIRAADSLDISLGFFASTEMDPEFQEIHDLLTDHLAFPEAGSLPKGLSIERNIFEDCYVGASFVGAEASIDVTANVFAGCDVVGALETGFPGALLGKLLDLIIDSGMMSPSSRRMAASSELGASAVQAATATHTFPDYNGYVTYKGNMFEDCTVGSAVGLNAGALFTGDVIERETPPEDRLISAKGVMPLGDRNRFGWNTCGILLANGPGEVTVQQNDFRFNDIAIADLGYRLAYDSALLMLMGEISGDQRIEALVENLDGIVDEFEEVSQSSLLVESCRFDLGSGDGIWVLNDRVRANIRQNAFLKTLGDDEFEVNSLSAQDIDPEITLPGSAAIRVGLNFDVPESDETVQCVPDRVSITENYFQTGAIMDHKTFSASREAPVPDCFVLFDLADASEGEFDLHLNHFINLGLLSGDEGAAVVVLGDDEIDGSNNLWREGGEDDVITSEDKVLEYVVGSLDISPLLTDEVLDKDEDLEHTASGDVLIYTGTAEDTGFEVEVASGDQENLILKPVTEEQAQSAFTDEELEGLGGIFYLPLDIRVATPEEITTNLTFRFENVRGLTNEELVVKTTTSNGVVTWDPANAYISEDGEWIILVVGPDTTPSIDDFTGSVTVTASKNADVSGSGGGCQVGFAPVSALLLLLPLVSLKRR